jgi:hypothetical protein
MEEYGATDARRSKMIKRAALVLLVVLAAGTGLYFWMRDRREMSQARTFLDLLRQKQYEEAYRVWGCASPERCPSYPYQRFLSDWGPESPYADLSKMQIARTHSCNTGIIQILKFGENDEVRLWVQRGDLTLGFAPWPVCNPHIPAPGQ